MPPSYCLPEYPLLQLGENVSPRLLVVVDTEEEFDWSAPADPNANKVSAIRYIHRVQDIFDEYKIKPCYVVDYSVASQHEAFEVIRDIYTDERCEFGAHLHPWINPPMVEERIQRNTYPGNLSRELEFEKIACLTESLEDVFGKRPQVYKAGRYGLGTNTYEILEELGYNIDLSVCATMEFRAEGGPDYRNVSASPFCFGQNQNCLGVPTSGAFVGWAGSAACRLHDLAQTLDWARMPAILARMKAVDRLMLSPEGYTHDEHKLLTRHLLKQGIKTFTWSFHSPSVVPGFSPYVSTESELSTFLDSFRCYFDYFFGELGGVAVTPQQLLAEFNLAEGV